MKKSPPPQQVCLSIISSICPATYILMGYCSSSATVWALCIDLIPSPTGIFSQSHAMSCRHSGAHLSPSPQIAKNKNKERKNTNLAELQRHFARTHSRNPSQPFSSTSDKSSSPFPSSMPSQLLSCARWPIPLQPTQELTNQVTSLSLSCQAFPDIR